MSDSSGQVVSIGARSHERRQRARRATVRAALVEARSWIDAGLAGSVSLESATCSAAGALSPAEREVLRSALG